MSDVPHDASSPVVAGLGEALFDCFVDRNVLGGAPVNFAFQIHQLLQGVGGQGITVSRIGDDELGRQLVAELERRGMSTHWLQVDRKRPTGQVQVTLGPTGEPSYEITEDVAWDHLTFDDSLKQLAAKCDAVCFGTLAQRSAASRAAIEQFVGGASQAIRVLDVNLRQHYFNEQILQSSLRAASVVKLNEDELAKILELFPETFRTARTVDEQAAALLDRFELDLIALTRGPRGTAIFTSEGRVEGEPIAKQNNPSADDVGAGDACCAGLIYGLLKKWPHERTVALANRMGAYVASQRGGTPPLSNELLELAGAKHN